MIFILHVHREQRIQKLRKTIDYLAYGSLVLDVCITILTLLSLFQSFSPQNILVPVNYLLTVVVVVSIASASMMVYLKHEEKLFSNTFRLTNHIREKFDNIRNRKYRYSGRKKINF